MMGLMYDSFINEEKTMSGNTPQKDQLVHNNLAHKLLLWGVRHPGKLALGTEAICSEGSFPLVWIEETGFAVGRAGAEFILSNISRERLSHREVKIMRDMTKPVPRVKAQEVAPVPQMIKADISTELAQLF